MKVTKIQNTKRKNMHSNDSSSFKIRKINVLMLQKFWIH